MYFSLCSTTRQILRDAQNDKMIESSYFDTPTFIFCLRKREGKRVRVTPSSKSKPD